MKNGFINSVFQFFKKIFSRKKTSGSLPGSSKREYAKPSHHRGYNLDCNIGIRIANRSSQRKRRKMARRTGRYA